MDGDRFDSIARSLANGISRRQVLKLLSGASAGGFLVATGHRETSAFICRQGGVLCALDGQCCSGSCVDNHCLCPEGRQLCQERVCSDLQSDVNNCGSCGTVCTTNAVNADAICTSGQCGVKCNADARLCGGVCILESACCTNDDCANLDDQCHQGECQNGSCLTSVLVGQTCDDANACTTGTTCQPDGSCGGGTTLNCDDGLACTTDTCNPSSGCIHTLQSGFCLIDGICFAAGQANPGNPCQLCNPAIATTTWTNAPSTTSCGTASCNGLTFTPAGTCDGQGSCSVTPISCTASLTCTTATCDPATGCGVSINAGFCVIDGACVSAGTTQPGLQCSSCQPAVSTTSWSPVAGGTSCQLNSVLSGTCCGDGGSCCAEPDCRCCGTISCFSPDICHSPGDCE